MRISYIRSDSGTGRALKMDPPSLEFRDGSSVAQRAILVPLGATKGMPPRLLASTETILGRKYFLNDQALTLTRAEQFMVHRKQKVLKHASFIRVA